MRLRAPATLSLRTFASLRRHHNFRLYFASYAISFAGSWMQQIAAYWLVLELTGSPVAVGALALAQLLPVTLFGLVAGPLLDRLDVRRALFATEGVTMLSAATLAALTLSGAVELWHVYAVGTVQGLASVVGNPGRHALLFRIVGPADLPNAVALSSGLGTTARVLGPALGGIVVAAAGTGVAFALNAVSFLAVLGALVALRTAELLPATAPRTGLLAGARESLAFAVSSRRVAVAFFTVLLVSTLSFNFDVLVPLLAGRTLGAGPEVFGLIAAVFGGGALCGALVLATASRASMKILLAGAGGFGALELALSVQTTLAAVCALIFLVGVFYVLWGSSALATLQLAAPPHLRATAASLYFFAFMGGAPLGGLLAGWLVAQGGTRLAFAFAGTCAVVVAASGSLVLARGRRAAGRRLAEPVAAKSGA